MLAIIVSNFAMACSTSSAVGNHQYHFTGCQFVIRLIRHFSPSLFFLLSVLLAEFAVFRMRHHNHCMSKHSTYVESDSRTPNDEPLLTERMKNMHIAHVNCLHSWTDTFPTKQLSRRQLKMRSHYIHESQDWNRKTFVGRNAKRAENDHNMQCTMHKWNDVI